jgi:glycosyltransferase involved in cell wall biosynthesis
MDPVIDVTVGMPLFNAARFLRYTINSILNQTFKNFELIITDDGSTDDSLMIARSYNDSRIIVTSDGMNKGIYYRLNEQISMAKGRFFFRMDADDLMFPTRIEKQVSFLENHPDIDAIGSQAIVIDDKNKILGFRDSKLPVSFNEVLRKVIFIHPTVSGRIEWFRKFGFSTQVEDLDLGIRSFKYSKFDILNEPLLFYRDPLEIKLRTYLFRQKEIRKVYSSYRNVYINNFVFLKLSFISRLKSIIYYIACKSGFSRRLIARRNETMTPQDINRFNLILSETGIS